MNIDMLTAFFMWCTVINGSLLILWTACCAVAPGLVYRTQNWVCPMPRQTFDVVLYAFLGLFKIMFLVFNLVPYIALRLVG